MIIHSFTIPQGCWISDTFSQRQLVSHVNVVVGAKNTEAAVSFTHTFFGTTFRERSCPEAVDEALLTSGRVGNKQELTKLIENIQLRIGSIKIRAFLFSDEAGTIDGENYTHRVFIEVEEGARIRVVSLPLVNFEIGYEFADVIAGEIQSTF